jgi:ABC-type uncharacterized transport system auxiliary subunit
MLLLILVNALQSCSLGGGPAPQDHFYRLPEVVLNSQVEEQAGVYKNIVIKAVKSSGLYHERAILFIESDRPLELQRYHYSFWATTPAELVHNGLYQGLQSSGIAMSVSRDISEARPDFIIDSRIIHFERFIDAQNVTVEVALEVSIRSGNLSAPAVIKRYKVSEALASMDMHASAEAFGQALSRIVEQLVADLGTLADKK